MSLCNNYNNAYFISILPRQQNTGELFLYRERSKVICEVIPYEATDIAGSSCTFGILKMQTIGFLFIRNYVYSIILRGNCLHYIQSIFPS